MLRFFMNSSNVNFYFVPAMVPGSVTPLWKIFSFCPPYMVVGKTLKTVVKAHILIQKILDSLVCEGGGFL